MARSGGFERAENRLGQYGPTMRFGSHTRSQKAGKGGRRRAVALRLCGLAAHSKYHYRIVTHNADGRTNGGDRTFATNRLPGLSDVFRTS